MKIEPQSTPDLVRLGELIANRPLAMLTSVGDDGALVSCPMEALEMDAEGALWFFTDLRPDLAERLRVVNLSFADDARGTYVSISGRGEIAKDPVRIQRLWTLFDRAAFPEGPSSRHLALLKVVTEKAEYWDAPNEPDRPRAHARRLGRRRHADRSGRSRRPDRPVRAAAVERRRRSMRNPLAAWRAGVRWPLATLGLAAALVVAVLVFESIGWPFLVSPVQSWLSRALDRRVEFNDEAGGQSGVRVGLLGDVRITAQRIEVGAPAWSKEPHTLLARDARLRLGYLDLWRAWRGGPLRIRALEARELDAAIERRADGRASWQFGKSGRRRRSRRDVAAGLLQAARRQGPRHLLRRGVAGFDRGLLRAERRQRAGRGGASRQRRVRRRRHLRSRRRRRQGGVGSRIGGGTRARRAGPAPQRLRPLPQASGPDRAAHRRRPRPARRGQ